MAVESAPPAARNRSWSIRRRLTMLSVGVLAGTLLLAGAGVLFFVFQTEQQAWRGREQEAARGAAASVSGFVQRIRAILDVVSHLDDATLAAQPDLLADLIAHHPEFLEVVCVDGSGRVIAGATRDRPVLSSLITLSQSTWFREVSAGRSHLGDVQLSAENEPYMIAAVPRTSGGAIAARLKMDFMWETAAGIGFGESGSASVVATDGRILAHRNHDLVLELATLAGRAELASIQQAPGNEWSGIYVNLEGSRVLGTATRVPDTEWIVLAELPLTEALSISLRALVLLGAGLVLFGLVSVGITLSALRLIVFRPIESLGAGVKHVGEGDLAFRVQEIRDDEIGRVAAAFNRMAQRLGDVLHDEQVRRGALQAAVDRYVVHMAQVESGNLAARLEMDGAGPFTEHGMDPIDVLGRNLNDLTASLHAAIAGIHAAAGQLAGASLEILAVTGHQAAGASEQSAATAQMAATVDAVRVIATDTVMRGERLATVAQQAVSGSLTGQQAVEHAVDSVERIRAQVEGIAENILTLSAHTQQIGEITASVNDLATRSNLLALNAAVEAARAGEQGKGFAVVAREMRSLATQSRQATVQVRAILEEIRQATNAAVMATEEGIKRADEGVHRAVEAGAAIRQLAGVLDESALAAGHMAAGGRQQAAGIEQVAAAMQHINQITAEGLASTRQTERAARDLDALARQLAGTVELYQL